MVSLKILKLIIYSYKFPWDYDFTCGLPTGINIEMDETPVETVKCSKRLTIKAS